MLWRNFNHAQPTHFFTGSQGESVAVRLDTPDKPPKAWALCAHCFTCSKDSKGAFYIARTLAEAAATLGAPFHPSHVIRSLGEGLQIIEQQGEARVALAGREFTVRRAFLDDLSGQPQADRIAALGKPLLILHAPGDDTVDVDNARRIFETTHHPTSLVEPDGANHLPDLLEDASCAARMIATRAMQWWRTVLSWFPAAAPGHSPRW